MAQKNPNIFDVSYTHPAKANQSPARIVRYLTRRPLDKNNPNRESQWNHLPKGQVFGDPQAFKREANRRIRELKQEAEKRGKDLSKNKSARACSYLHVVLSPTRRAEFSDRDFKMLLEPWIKDANGRELPYFATIHREKKERSHLHLLVARDKIERKRELPYLKERTAEIISEKERKLDLEREMDRELERLQEQERAREAR